MIVNNEYFQENSFKREDIQIKQNLELGAYGANGKEILLIKSNMLIKAHF